MVSGSSFDLIPDSKYDALRTYPVPQDLASYYDHPNYISHQEKARGFFYRIYNLFRFFNNQFKLRLLKHYAPQRGTLLDFGAGTATFVQAANRQGWKAVGYDPMVSQSAGKKNLYVTRWEKENHYHCITAWHVIEHLEDPQTFFIQANTSLQPDGLLVVALPNCISWDADFYKDEWAAYDVPRHLWHFSPKGITDMAKDHGFEFLAKHPLRIDAYYNALLSEKIQQNSFPWVRAAINGLRSNCKANRTKMYSSLVYIFKKPK